MAVAVRYAALSDIGLVRASNQDSGYAGPHLLVVADGMGGHAGGDVASSLAIGQLAGLDGQSLGGDTLSHLSAAVHSAHGELLQRVREEPALSGMGTTVTALLRSGNRLALAHIGDSRAYVLRDGLLTQITRDHTFVQTLVDDGRLTPEEAEIHPQRSVLIRVLSDVVDDVEPDLSMREARVGDRYLLCSDGLSGVVSLSTLEDALRGGQDPATTCETLVAYARRAGAPDNVTCIVADVVDDAQGVDTTPFVVGAATSQRSTRVMGTSAAERAAELTSSRPRDSGGYPHDDEDAASADDGKPSRGRAARAVRRTLFAAVVVVVVIGGVYGAWRWVQTQFYVSSSAGQVAIFKGLSQDLGPISLSSVDTLEPDVQVTELPAYSRERLDNGITASDRTEAQKIVQDLRDLAAQCASGTSPTSPVTPAATATGAAVATATTPAAGTTATPTPGVTATPTTSPTAPATPSQGCEGIG